MIAQDRGAARDGSLDPEDWEQFRAVGHEMLDDMVDYLRTVRERPAWQSPPRTPAATSRPRCPARGRP